jgi:hypothetical protein
LAVAVEVTVAKIEKPGLTVDEKSLFPAFIQIFVDRIDSSKYTNFVEN